MIKTHMAVGGTVRGSVEEQGEQDSCVDSDVGGVRKRRIKDDSRVLASSRREL